ncbi:MAG: transposase [Methanobrevibacter sp.]|nr:transposase [Candidatus Methanoflexus mossambicus]
MSKNTRYLNSLNPKHGKKIEEQKKKNLEENINQDHIINLFQKEKRINIVLDNYTVHHAEIIQNITNAININLIYLPKSASDLNPIEDVWRKIKREVSGEFIERKKHLSKLYTTYYNEFVDDPTLYENWINEFIKME